MSRRRPSVLMAAVRAIAGSTSTARSDRMRRTRARPILMRGCVAKDLARRLSYMGQALMENRHGMLVDFQVTTATGTAERDVLPHLIDDAPARGFHPKK